MKITLAEGHVYRDETGAEWPGVTGTLKSAGLIDARWFDEYSRTRGEYVHLACAMDDRGELDEASLDPVIRPYVEAWRAFRRESGCVMVAVEELVYNPILRYAGTLDWRGRLNGRHAIIDRKTGPCQPWTGLQLAAYAAPFNEPHDRYGIQLKDDGRYKLTKYDDINDLAVFRSALILRNWKVNNP